MTVYTSTCPVPFALAIFHIPLPSIPSWCWLHEDRTLDCHLCYILSAKKYTRWREAVSSSQVCSNNQGRFCLKNIFSVIHSQTILVCLAQKCGTWPCQEGEVHPQGPEASLKAEGMACWKKPCSTETAEVKPGVWGSPAQRSILGPPPYTGTMLPWVLKDSLLRDFIHRASHPATLQWGRRPPFRDKNGTTCFRRCWEKNQLYLLFLVV